MTRVEKGPGWELRLGRWQDVLADVAQVDSVITDPPYSERTHVGQRSVKAKERTSAYEDRYHGDVNKIDYSPLDEVRLPCMDAAKWVVIFSDNIRQRQWQVYLEDCGRYTFSPLPWCKTNPVPRLAGDGPACAAEFITVSRKRARYTCGSLPGFYIGQTAATEDGDQMMGRKPMWLMRAIVRDYSRPSDLVCDPYAGSGTTLLAAVMEGRMAIGAEMDEGRFDMAVRRLRGGFTTDLFGGA